MSTLKPYYDNRVWSQRGLVKVRKKERKLTTVLYFCSNSKGIECKNNDGYAVNELCLQTRFGKWFCSRGNDINPKFCWFDVKYTQSLPFDWPYPVWYWVTHILVHDGKLCQELLSNCKRRKLAPLFRVDLNSLFFGTGDFLGKWQEPLTITTALRSIVIFRWIW